jgi:hypothetical protein
MISVVCAALHNSSVDIASMMAEKRLFFQSVTTP